VYKAYSLYFSWFIGVFWAKYAIERGLYIVIVVKDDLLDILMLHEAFIGMGLCSVTDFPYHYMWASSGVLGHLTN
jgi:hypothetical protein